MFRKERCGRARRVYSHFCRVTFELLFQEGQAVTFFAGDVIVDTPSKNGWSGFCFYRLGVGSFETEFPGGKYRESARNLPLPKLCGHAAFVPRSKDGLTTTTLQVLIPSDHQRTFSLPQWVVPVRAVTRMLLETPRHTRPGRSSDRKMVTRRYTPSRLRPEARTDAG
jgi:hypothetical protein